MDTPPPPSVFLENLDLREPGVTAELVRTYGLRLSALINFVVKNEDSDDSRLENLFLSIINSRKPFNPAADPTFEAWLYRAAIEHILAGLPGRERNRVRKTLVYYLADKPHQLTPLEISNSLNIREHLVEKLLRGRVEKAEKFSTTSIPEKADFQKLINSLQDQIRISQPDKTSKYQFRLFPLQEALWLVVGLSIIMAAITFFVRSSNADQGIALFPTPTPPPPRLITVENPNIHPAPIQISPFDQRWYQSTSPRISDDGRWGIFMSSHPFLVERDTNDAYDVFLYEFSTGILRRVSVYDNTDQMQGDSFLPDLSSDGSHVAFLHLKTNGEIEILIRDWLNLYSERVPLVINGEKITHVFSLSLSGSGTTVAFYGMTESMEAACVGLEEGYTCADLYIWQMGEPSPVQVPLGYVFMPWAEHLPITFDGSLVGLTVTHNDVLWQRLGSPNSIEAVLYDWRDDTLIPLNRTTLGEFGDGSSRWPDLSADGKYVLFSSSATNLIANTPDATALYLLDRTTREIISIDPPEGEIFNADIDPMEANAAYGNQPSLSANGNRVLYLTIVPSDSSSPNTAACGQFEPTGRICLQMFLYDRATSTSSVIDLGPLYKAGALFTMVRFPTLSANGERFTIALEGWEYSLPCPMGACATIWAFLSDEDSVRHVSSDLQSRSAGASTGWEFIGNLTGPSRWVKGLGIAPNGQWIATGDQEGVVSVYYTADNSPMYSFNDHSRAINAIAVSPRGDLLAAAAQDSSVIVWNIDSGIVEAGLYDHPGITLDLSFSPDGDKLAVGSQQALSIWSLENQDFVLTKSYAQKSVNAVSFSPDGKWIAYANDREVWIRRVSDGEVVVRLGGHTDRILDVAFSPVLDSGYLLATSSSDNQVILWDMNTSELNPQIEYQSTLQHNSWASTLAFSPNGDVLAVGGFDSFVNLWRIPSGEHIQDFQRGRQDQVLALAFTPDGKTLYASTVNGVRTWHDQASDIEKTRSARFFAFTDNDRITVTPSYSANWFRTDGIIIEEVLSVFQAWKLNAEFRIPHDAPLNFTLESIAIYRSEQGEVLGSALRYLITTNFQPARLTIMQSKLDPRVMDWPIYASADIIDTKILTYPAELVLGGWGFPEENNDRSTVRRWNADAASRWLRWQDEDGFISIFYDQPYNSHSLPFNEKIDVGDIMLFAESLYPTGPNRP